MLDAYVIRPATFDSTVAYPMLLHIYGGPDSRQVTDAWGGARYLWHQYLANELNMVVSVVDNRGTGRRGKAFTSSTYRQLGVLEAADQIAAAQWFGSQTWIDEDRMGIWGWSYGGYMTLVSMLMGEGPETFKVGLSIAPVTDWRQYDTIYTERYMSTPQSNPDGYAAGAPLNYADRLSDEQRLLLVHGDLDDNVHLQNTTQMSDALIQANRPFDLMIYPGRNHGIYGGNVRLHLHTMLTDYLREHLID
jgi:dipeptidyl-peptidase-4